MENLDLIEKISSHCNEMVKNDSDMLKWRFGVTEEDLPHVASIAKSIVLHKNNLLKGGGFVEAVCSDSLSRSAAKADSVMQKVLCYISAFSENAYYIKGKLENKIHSNL
jgi:hypothetical protein